MVGFYCLMYTKSGFNSFKLFQNKRNKKIYENVSNINIAQYFIIIYLIYKCITIYFGFMNIF